MIQKEVLCQVQGYGCQHEALVFCVGVCDGSEHVEGRAMCSCLSCWYKYKLTPGNKMLISVKELLEGINNVHRE